MFKITYQQSHFMLWTLLIVPNLHRENLGGWDLYDLYNCTYP